MCGGCLGSSHLPDGFRGLQGKVEIRIGRLQCRIRSMLWASIVASRSKNASWVLKTPRIHLGVDKHLRLPNTLQTLLWATSSNTWVLRNTCASPSPLTGRQWSNKVTCPRSPTGYLLSLPHGFTRMLCLPGMMEGCQVADFRVVYQVCIAQAFPPGACKGAAGTRWWFSGLRQWARSAVVLGLMADEEHGPSWTSSIYHIVLKHQQ